MWEGTSHETELPLEMAIRRLSLCAWIYSCIATQIDQLDKSNYYKL